MAVRRKKKAVAKRPRKKVKKRKESDTHKGSRRSNKPRPGMIPFVPTTEQRTQVELMIGLGMTYKEISILTLNPRTNKGISINTLQEHFAGELASGGPRLKRQVVGALFKKATSDNHPGATTASIFLCKTRYGYRETQVVEHQGTTGVLIAPAGMTPEEWIAASQKRNDSKKSPVE